jgi:hypothetical protein
MAEAFGRGIRWSNHARRGAPGSGERPSWYLRIRNSAALEGWINTGAADAGGWDDRGWLATGPADPWLNRRGAARRGV